MRNTICTLGLNLTASITNLFTSLFVTLYLYDLSSGDVMVLCKYWVSFCLSLLTAMFIHSHLFSKSRHRKWLEIIGSSGRLLFLVALVLLSESSVAYIIPLGILNGFFTGTYYTTHNIYDIEGIQEDIRRRVIGIYEILNMSMKIVFPLLSGWLIYKWGMASGVVCVICLSCISVLFSILYKDEGDSIGGKFSIKRLFNSISSNRDTQETMSMFFSGCVYRGVIISYGALDIFLSVFMFKVFHTSLSVGLLNSLCNLIAILFSFIFAAYSKRLGRKVSMLNFGSWVVIAMLMFLLLVNVSPVVMTILLGVFSITRCIDSCVYFSSRNSFINSKDLASYRQEIYLVGECFLTVGRMIGFLLLYLYGLNEVFLPICLCLYGLALVLMGGAQRKFYNKQYKC